MPEPVQRLVPLRVTAFSTPPVKPDWRTSNGATSTWYCSIASSGIGLAFASPPGRLLARPKTSWLSAPSIWIALKRSFCPATEIRSSSTLTCGDSAANSVKSRDSEGSFVTISLSRTIAAPMCAGSNTGSGRTSTCSASSSIGSVVSSKSSRSVWPIVWAARPQVQQVEATVVGRHRGDRLARRQVTGLDRGAGDGGAAAVGHTAADRRRGLGVGVLGRGQGGEQQEKRNCCWSDEALHARRMPFPGARATRGTRGDSSGVNDRDLRRWAAKARNPHQRGAGV